MKVFFSCPVTDILQYESEYLAIRKVILNEGHELVRDWLERSLVLAKAGTGDITLNLVYPKVAEAILAADIVILEGSVKSTNLGYQLDYALQKGKPVLFLAKKSQKEMQELFIAAINSQLLTLKGYSNVEQLKEIVEDYLRSNDRKTSTRFNLVIDRRLANYLEWAAFMYKENKTDIIKKSLEHRLSSDERYQRYLKGGE